MDLRSQLPALRSGDPASSLAYLDSAATTPTPQPVIDAVAEAMARGGSPGRGLHRLGFAATQALADAREQIAARLGGAAAEVVFVRSATDGLNLVAAGWAAPRLAPGDAIVVGRDAHSSNLLPWLRLCEARGATLDVVGCTATGELDLGALARVLGPRTRLVALTHVSNVTGAIAPISAVAAAIRASPAAGALLVVDGAQALAHLPVDLPRLGCDVYVASAHKAYGPPGFGVVWAPARRWAETEPLVVGGGTVVSIDLDRGEVRHVDGREQFRVLGTPARRVDNHAKVTGTAAFGIDIRVPNMVKATMLHPPRKGATVISLAAEEAKKQPGVVDVVITEGGVGVVAERFWQAQRAARLVKVEWSPGDMPEFSTESLRRELAESSRERARAALDEGDVDAASGTPYEAVYEAPYLAHAPMEPLNAIAHVTEEGCEIWSGNQSPTMLQEAVAQVLGRERGDVLVHTPFLGGAFGRRTHPEAVLDAVRLSKAVGRPVQVIWTREDDMKSGRYRPQAWARIYARMDDAGTVHALGFDTASQSIMAEIGLGALFPDAIPPRLRHWLSRNANRLIDSNAVIADIIATEGATNHGYAIANRRVTYMPFKAPVSVSWWRSVGFSINTFVVESFLDELAHAAKQDPYQFRRRMLAGRPRWLGVLDAVAELSGWGTRALPPGVARGIAVCEAFGSFCAEVIEARIEGGEIKVDTVYAVLDCGFAVNPDLVESQVEGSVIFGLTAALWGEITLEKGVVQQQNFDTYRMMRIHETPRIVTRLIEGDPEPGGVGEPAVAPLAAALANAIFTLTGERLRRMPLQAEYDRRTAAAKS